MKIEFEAPLARGRKANPRDVRRAKFALGCWGYYTPDPIFGITGEMDEGCWKALRAFQRAHMIPFTDTAGPGSVTERVMNEELAALRAEDAFFVWRTAGDDKVRVEHAQRADRVFTFASPPDGELPGEDYNCRCWAEPLTSSLHVLAEEARRGQGAYSAPAISSGAKGMPIPEPAMPPELQAVSAATVLWGTARITVAACWGNKVCRAWMIREGVKIILENSHHLPPKDLPAFPDAKRGARKGRRERWIDSKGRIYEWDYKKGEVEIYDKTGKKHHGGFDPNTGKQRSKSVPSRKIEK